MPEIPGSLEFVERCRKYTEVATPGPWMYGSGNSEVLCEDGIIEESDGSAILVNCGRGAGNARDEDYSFIASVRADFPLALTAIEEHLKRIAELEAENSCMARQLAEPPERLLCIAELEPQLADAQKDSARMEALSNGLTYERQARSGATVRSIGGVGYMGDVKQLRADIDKALDAARKEPK